MIAADFDVRQRALNAHESFIVQAPAGAGKTELLTQRFLKLLGEAVSEPEEIVAITFTRKAAQEMKTRVMNALQRALQPEPEESHLKTTWKLAKKALECNDQFNWQLTQTPHRLRILTIDALIALINHQMPLLEEQDAPTTITHHAIPLYQQAVFSLLKETHHSQALQKSWEILLHQFHNQIDRLAEWMMALLSKRDQWLPILVPFFQNPDAAKIQLENVLQSLVEDILYSVDAFIPQSIKSEWLTLLRFASNQFPDSPHPFTPCKDLLDWPTPGVENLPHWKAIAHFALTQKGEYRQTIDTRLGFPAKEKSWKQRALELLQQLQGQERLQEALQRVQQCPPTSYSAQQWERLEALIHLLPLLAVHCHSIFKQEGLVDFTELTLRAHRTLGSSENPSQVLLQWDYQLKHLLVDEFQDTSVVQYQLLSLLTSGWEPNDGRTLFFVGDPMQSIYRFRNAEVSLFLKAQTEGLNQRPLIPLTLTQNFRSEAPLIEWINQFFALTFPKEANPLLGAIPFTAAIASKSSTRPQSVFFHLETLNRSQAEMPTTSPHHPKLMTLIQDLLRNHPEERVALLVETRNQLKTLISDLKAAQLPFHAVETDPLANCPEIQDLVSLTRAFASLQDRLAWLSILRAPWCGLLLHDLHLVATHQPTQPIWHTLRHYTQLPLSPDGLCRLQRVVPILQQGMDLALEAPHRRIEVVWIALGGPACLQHAFQLENTHTYFRLLSELPRASLLTTLTSRLDTLFAKPMYPESAPIHLMTIHKSKGLEFDHVILPALEKRTAGTTRSLLLWLEHAPLNRDIEWILAPLSHATESEPDTLYTYLHEVEKKRLSFEDMRLFYVATTRAKKTLHFHFRLALHEETQAPQPPPAGTLAQLLWKTVPQQIESILPTPNTVETSPLCVSEQLPLMRLPSDWQSPCYTASVHADRHSSYQHNHLSWDIPETNERATFGTIVHEILAGITHPPQEFASHEIHWLQRLRQLGVSDLNRQTFWQEICSTLPHALQDPRLQWILAPHRETQTEYPLYFHDGKTTHLLIMDRTFIDEQGIRWIIDYKTARPSPHEDPTDFLEREQTLHKPQLERYGHALKLQGDEPIRFGVYFPMCQLWLEWEQ